METIENMLLEEIRKMTSKIKKGNDLGDKLRNLSSKKKENFFNLLATLLDGDKITNEIKYFKTDFCKLIYDVINEKKYHDNAFFTDKIGSQQNDNFKKIMLMSFMISKAKDIPPLNVMNIILNKKFFEQMYIFEITNIANNELFIQTILLNDLESLEKGVKENEIHYEIFLKLSNTHLLNYINKEEFNVPSNVDKTTYLNNKKESSFNTEKIEKINDTNNKNIIITNEKENNNFIVNFEKNQIIDNINQKKDERMERFSKLINRSILLKNNELFPESSILDINYKNIHNIKDKVDKSQILIDNYEMNDKTKFYLFSPVSLILNNIKGKFDKNDFELFNSDNYYIQMFGDYLNLIITNLNNYINKGTDYDFIEKNKVKLGCNKTHFYLCCIFNEKFKNHYFDNIKEYETNIKKNNQGKDNLKVIKVNDEHPKEFEKKPKKGNGDKESSTYSSAKFAKDNYKNKLSNAFENEITEFLFEEGCEGLQNIIFFFNLIMPKNIDDKIEFEFIRLSFSDLISSFYGFREIDICFKNKKERILDSDVLTNNICFYYDNNKFKRKKPEEIDVYLKANSIIFCEVKNSFPTPKCNITYGDNNCLNIQVDTSLNNNDNNTFNHIEQIENLMKKAKLYYDFFLNENIFDDKIPMHIFYLYDESNINSWNLDFDYIESTITDFLKDFHFPSKVKNIIFQIAYFDKENHKKIEKIKAEKILQSKDAKIQELKDLLNKHNINFS